MEKKAKVSICPKCGYGIPVRAESCRRCATPAEKKQEMKLQVKKINIAQKKPKSSPSGARTTSRKPKANRPGVKRTKSVRSIK